MKNKYASLLALVALLGGGVAASRAVPNEPSAQQSANTQAQVAQLEKRLTDRIAEQEELMTIVGRLLEITVRQRTDEDAKKAQALSGTLKPASLPAAKPARTPAPPPPPWWTDLNPQMVYMGGDDRYAVVNGKMVRPGESVGNGTTVQAVEGDSVVFRHGSETHTLYLKK